MRDRADGQGVMPDAVLAQIAEGRTKWDRVFRALDTLYQLHHTEETQSEPVRLALEELMKAYDDWLD